MIDDTDPQRIRDILARAVNGYKPSTIEVDWLADMPTDQSKEVISLSAGYAKDRHL